MSTCFCVFLCMLLVVSFCNFGLTTGKKYGEKDLAEYRRRVVNMFHHAYDGYINNAYPYDELRPLTCDGHDTWGSFSLTLIDALSTLAVMGNYSEFQRVTDLLDDAVNFDIDINASVFETNIRVVGGLLSAHLLSKKAGLTLEPGWPCSGPLLRLAETVARKLLPAFNTTTGMPYGTVNLLYGVPKGETTVTCTSGVGTFIVEFGALSRLTGDMVFENAAMRALRALWKTRSSIGLVGNHIDVMTGKWTATEGGIGGGVDSYFEYLVKGAVMFQSSELLNMYREYEKTLETYVKRDDWYMWANMNKGGITLPVFQSLDAFWPGMQSLIGDLDKAMKTIHNFHQVWRQFGFTPEIYNIPKGEAHQGREGYPLRPELVESAMYLYRATGDPYLLEIGIDILEAIEHSTKTKCGYATVKDVTSHSLENRMESFFLAETTKYLYLLFTPDHFIHNTGNHGDVVQTPNGECVIDAGGYVFNTEAHPIDMAALYCCSAQKKEDDLILQDLHDNLDLLTLFDVIDPENDLFAGKTFKKRRKKFDLKTDELKRNLNAGRVKGETSEKQIQKMKIEEAGAPKNNHFISSQEAISSTEEAETAEKKGLAINEEEIEDIDLNSEEESPKDKTEDKVIQNSKSDSNTHQLMKEVSSKLNIDFSQLSALVDSLGNKEETKSAKGGNSETPPVNSLDTAPSEKSSDLDPETKSEDADPLETVSQEGEWVHVRTKTPKSKEKSATGKDLENSPLVKELSAMLKNILSSSSKDVFSGNSGFSFGEKKNIQTDVILENTNSPFGGNRPEQLVCPAQPYHMRFSVMGEMFDE